MEQPCAMSSASGRISAAAPALAMFKTFDGGAPVVMSGELSRSRMHTFAQVEALPLVVEYSAQVEDTLFASSIGLHVLLFYDGARPELEGVTAAAKALRGEAVFSLIQASKHLEVGEFFDVQPKGSLSPPVALAFVLDDSTKYAHRGALDEPSLVAFVRGVQSGSATPHYRSQPVPTTSGPVVELVGSTYAAAIADPDKDVLVQLYSPDCGHCRKLAPVYEAVARKLADDGDLVVAQIDASANDIAGRPQTRARARKRARARARARAQARARARTVTLTLALALSLPSQAWSRRASRRSSSSRRPTRRASSTMARATSTTSSSSSPTCERGASTSAACPTSSSQTRTPRWSSKADAALLAASRSRAALPRCFFLPEVRVC